MTLHILFFCLFSLVMNASERILLFQSDIDVHHDATVTITETITVESHGQQIKRGIIRELPGTWKYKIVSVKKDGKSVFYQIAHAKNQLEIHIGGNDLIARGKHTYQITYTTDDFIDFYKDYDELYLNITGNYWRLPIDQAKASITLPDDVDQSKITAEAYTGKLGSRGTDYRYNTQKNIIFFETTRPFRSGEGLTAVITWNKDVVQKPFWYVHWYENPYFYLVIISFFLQLIFLVYLAIMRRQNNKPGVIVPLFYPPKGMTPSILGYMTKIASFEDKLVVADIIQLAVEGYLSISTQSSFADTIHSFFGRTVYTLTLLKKEGATPYQQSLLETLFLKNNNYYGITYNLTSKNKEPLEHAKRHVLKQCQTETTTLLSAFPLFSFVLGETVLHGVSLFLFFYFYTIGFRHIDFYPYVYAAGSFLLIMASSYLNRWYSKTGRKIQDEIDGFLLFLTTTEIDRMHTIGTPPTRTPELYETYLPYAIAVGAEYRWTKQFEKIFADMQQTGHPYRPRWYLSSRPFSVSSFSSQFSSSSSFRSSGAGGGGFSGGGRGGGGGGGR